MIDTRFTQLVGCRIPVVQTGMGWVSTPGLTAATSAAGGLGVLAGPTLSRDELPAAIAAVQARTVAPFGVNLRGDSPDLAARLELCIEAGVPVVSFAGAPPTGSVGLLHDHGVVVIPTIGARRHAEKMVEAGVDAVIAQGGEGGGHTGSVPTSLLLPDVVAAVGAEVPVLAAGGFRDGAGLAAALAWGADGIAMGTRFLLTADSEVPDTVKTRYLQADVGDTVVTRAIDGAPQRVIRTDLVSRLEARSLLTRLPGAAFTAVAFARRMGLGVGDLARAARSMRRDSRRPWSEVLLAANAPMMVRASMEEGRLDAGVLPTGQVVGLVDDLPTVADLLSTICEDAELSSERFRRLFS